MQVNGAYWSLVRKTILDARPKVDVFLIDEIRGFPNLNLLNPHESHGFPVKSSDFNEYHSSPYALNRGT